MNGAYFPDFDWLADDTATEDAMTVTPPKPLSSTKVALCPACFSKQLTLCRKDNASGYPQEYWFVCTFCAAETAQVRTLSAVRDMVRWVPIDALLDAPQIAT